MVMIDENELALLCSYRDQHGHRSNEIGALRVRALKADAACAAMRAVIEQHECSPCPGFDRGTDGKDRPRRIAVPTDAGRPILDALVKAREALKSMRDRLEWGTPIDDIVLDDEAFRTVEGDMDAAIAAIEALGIRGGA